MGDQQTKRMHVVAAGYLGAFAVRAPERREPAVWRFERASGASKLLGVQDVGVVKDIYTVFGEDGLPDTGIEDEVLRDIDGAYCAARNALDQSPNLSTELWTGLARFLAFQLLRTPRSFQSTRDEFARHGVPHADDDPPKLMLFAAPWLERWLLHMEWAVVRNESDFPFLTSDEPAVMWKDMGTGLEIGPGFLDPALQITCALAPTRAFIARHTSESLRAVCSDLPHGIPEIPDCPIRITGGALTADQVRRFNLVTIANADRYLYANYNNARLQRFLTSRFVGAPAPVRREDRNPFGSPL
jgi:hypothetical protein